MIRAKYSTFTAGAVLTLCAACSSGDDGQPLMPVPQPGDIVPAQTDQDPSGTGSTDSTTGGGSSAPSGGSQVVVITPEGNDMLAGNDFIAEDENLTEDQQNVECASSSTGTSLVDVVLAFTFDVSASMGSHFESYFSRELKWEPVVAATKSFFSDPSSAGVRASLTFFPNEAAPLQITLTGGGGGGMIGPGGGGGIPAPGGAADECDEAAYSVPDVAPTELPSDAFGAAIDAITPAVDDDWRVGTPTGPAVAGTIESIRAMQETDPNAKYVIVLVSDGAPALCGGTTDQIETVSGIIADVADEIPTYVIGVGHPATDEDPMPPDDVSNLHVFAEAGGTGQAFIIDTNDPAKTSADFRAVIDSIRENSFSCAVEIPAPPANQEFDQEKVNVNYSNVMGATEFVYDPTCTEQFAWHYDDEANPGVILMCDSVCEAIRADSANQGQLNVEFGCVRRIPRAN